MSRRPWVHPQKVEFVVWRGVALGSRALEVVRGHTPLVSVSDKTLFYLVEFYCKAVILAQGGRFSPERFPKWPRPPPGERRHCSRLPGPAAGVHSPWHCVSWPPGVLRQKNDLSYTRLRPTLRLLRLLGESTFPTCRSSAQW